jgi:hypothetical protein
MKKSNKNFFNICIWSHNGWDMVLLTAPAEARGAEAKPLQKNNLSPQQFAALAAFPRAPERCCSALLAGKELFFSLYEFLGAEPAPFGNGAEDVFLPLRHRKIFNLVAGKTVAPIASFDSLLSGTAFDWAYRTIPVHVVGTASLAMYFFSRISVCFGEFFLQFLVAAHCCKMNAA